MNINMLEYLAAIEQYGSLSEAARHLYVSQPYLSRLVRQAEQEYGLTIFTRGREGLCPTEQGRLFLQMARDLAAQAQQFRRTFQAAGGAASLRIAAFPSTYGVDAFLQLLAENPDRTLRLSYEEQSSVQVVQQVHTRQADLGILFLKERNRVSNEAFFHARRIALQRVASTRMHLLLRVGHPLTRMPCFGLEELYRYGLVMFRSQPGTGVYSLEDGYYNDVSLADLLEFDRFRQVISVRSRATMHNLLAQTDCIALGNQIEGEELAEELEAGASLPPSGASACAEASTVSPSGRSALSEERIALIQERIDSWCVQRGYKDYSINFMTLSRSLSISKADLAVYFSQRLHTTFRVWLSDIRFRAAQSMMLEHPHYSNDVISAECGFSSRTQLYRIFKAKVGCTPTAWRERQSQQDLLGR